MKRATSVSNTWQARRLEMGQPAMASQGARQWLLSERGESECGRLVNELIGEVSR